MSQPRYVVSEREALMISRRVLRLARGYIRRQRADLLITDGAGLMTWGEILLHINETLALGIKRTALTAHNQHMKRKR